MNISEKFQLYRHYSFWGVDFLISLANRNQSNSLVRTKIICLVEDYSINISDKKKY